MSGTASALRSRDICFESGDEIDALRTRFRGDFCSEIAPATAIGGAFCALILVVLTAAAKRLRGRCGVERSVTGGRAKKRRRGAGMGFRNHCPCNSAQEKPQETYPESLR